MVECRNAGRPLAVLAAAIVCLSCGCSRGGDGVLPLSVHVVETSGAEYELTGIRQSFVTLEPLTTPVGGAEKLDADLLQLSQYRLQDNDRICTLSFRSGGDVAGRPDGHLEGMSDGLPRAIPWESIRTATFTVKGTPPKFAAPDGPWLRVAGPGLETLELYGIEIRTAWIVRHGTHAYRRDTAEAESLPFTVPREHLIREQWEVPLGRLQAIELMPYLTAAVVDLGDTKTLRIEGDVGGKLTQVEGDAGFTGVDQRGRWSLSLQRLKRAAVKAGEGRRPDQPAATVKLEVFGRRPAAAAATTPVGTMTDWDDRTLPVVASHLEPLRLREAGSVTEISPAELRSIEVYANPWVQYDERVSLEQWVAAKLTLADGRELAGDLADRFGSLECEGPAGLRVFVPAASIRRLNLTAPPAPPAGSAG